MTAQARLVAAASIFAASAALASPQAAAADGLPVAGIDAKPLSTPKGEVAYLTRRAGRDTTLEVVDARSERRLRRAVLPGRLSVPAVAYDAKPSGLTRGGRTLVLINPRRAFPRADTSFAIVDTRSLEIRRRLTLKGDFSFDALSPGGRIMYLIHYPSRRDVYRYEVRAYDLRRNHHLRRPIVDPREPDERMSGLPMTRATSADSRWEYTLYDGSEHAFIHALDTRRAEAFCIDLEGLDAPRRGLWGAKLDLGGDTLAVMAGAKLLASVDVRTLRVSIAEPRPRENARRGAAARAPGTAESGIGWPLPVLTMLVAAAVGVTAARRRRSRVGASA